MVAPMKNSNKELFLIGYGVNFAIDRSVIVDEYIQRCDVIYAVEPCISHLVTEIPNKRIINLIDLYSEGSTRVATYNKIVDTILESLDEFSSVGLLSEGSPFFLDSINSLASKKAQQRSINVTFVDGRSSLDKLIQSYRIPISHGIGVYLADNLCRLNQKINAEAVNIIFQPGNVDSDRVTMRTHNISGATLLKRHLLQHYNDTQNWFLFNLSQTSTEPNIILHNTLSNLDKFYPALHSGTLVISSSWSPL